MLWILGRLVGFYDVYMDEHPEFTQEQRDVLTCSRELSQAIADNGKLEPRQESMSRIIEREMRYVFDFDQLIEFVMAQREIRDNG